MATTSIRIGHHKGTLKFSRPTRAWPAYPWLCFGGRAEDVDDRIKSGHDEAETKVLCPLFPSQHTPPLDCPARCGVSQWHADKESSWREATRRSHSGSCGGCL